MESGGLLPGHVIEALALVPELAELGCECVGCELSPVVPSFGFNFELWPAVDDVGAGDLELPCAG